MIWDDSKKGYATGTVIVSVHTPDSDYNRIYLDTDIHGYNNMINQWHHAQAIQPGSNLDYETLMVMWENGNVTIVLWKDVTLLKYVVNKKEVNEAHES